MEAATTELLDEEQAAQLLHCTPAALARWRKEGRGPAYVKLSRLIRYGRGDLLQWIQANRIEPQSSQ